MTHGPLVDTHCHLDFAAYDADRDETIARAVAEGVGRIVVPSVNLQSVERVIALAESHEGLYAAVGVHPNDIPNDLSVEQALQALRAAAKCARVVAIGEIGLDYHWNKSPSDAQKHWLTQQLALARELGFPVILHNRESTSDILDIAIKWAATLDEPLRSCPGVLHSVSATWEEARLALDVGFVVGFTGPITFKNAGEIRQIAANAPSDQIVVETDGPFLTPHPHRGQRNEPSFVRFVAEELARVRSISVAEACHVTTQNAARLFGWRMAAA